MHKTAVRYSGCGIVQFGHGGNDQRLSTILAMFKPSQWSARSRWRVLFLALIGNYLFITFAAPILTDEAGLLWLRSPWLTRLDQFWLYGCVILVAGWTALAQGRLALRGAQGLVGVGWLLLLWLLGLTIAPNYKLHELEPTTLVCLILFTVVFTVLFWLRLGSGKMLLPTKATSRESVNERFQYSLTTLLLVMLLVGLTITLYGWIDQLYMTHVSGFRSYVQVTWSNGSLRRELASEVINEAAGPILIAAACLPAFWSRRFRGFAWALTLSAAVLFAVVAKDVWIRKLYYPQIGFHYLIETMKYFFFANLGNLMAVTFCLLIAAAAMHWLGYRFSARPAPISPGERPQESS